MAWTQTFCQHLYIHLLASSMHVTLLTLSTLLKLSTTEHQVKQASMKQAVLVQNVTNFGVRGHVLNWFKAVDAVFTPFFQKT